MSETELDKICDAMRAAVSDNFTLDHEIDFDDFEARHALRCMAKAAIEAYSEAK